MTRPGARSHGWPVFTGLEDANVSVVDFRPPRCSPALGKQGSTKATVGIAHVLGEIGAVTIPDLMTVLRDENSYHTPKAAARALGRIGLPAMLALIAVVSDGSDAVADAFGQIGPYRRPDYNDYAVGYTAALGSA